MDVLAALSAVTNEMDKNQISTGSRHLFITPTLRGVLDDFSASARPYDPIKLQVKKVVIHSSWAQVGMTNASYLCNAFENMTEFSGF